MVIANYVATDYEKNKGPKAPIECIANVQGINFVVDLELLVR